MSKIDKFCKTIILIYIILIIINILLLIKNSLFITKTEPVLVQDYEIYSELMQCIDGYVNNILAENYMSVNLTNSIDNYKTANQITELKESLIYLQDAEMILKKVYIIADEVYKCYFLSEYSDVEDKYGEVSEDKMNNIVIKLESDTSTYTVIDLQIRGDYEK